MTSPGQQPSHGLSQTRPTRVRHLVVLASMSMSILLYLDRFCVSFAADFIREDLHLSQSQIAVFLGAFFWSYALAQVPSGWLSDRYGARLMLAAYVLTWSIFTGVIGLAGSFFVLILARLGCGLGQAGAYPTSAGIVSKWVPFSNRGTASALIAFGGRIGGAIAPLLTAFLIVQFVPLGTPVEFQTASLLNSQHLCEKIAPRPRVDGEHSAANTSARTGPTAVGVHIWSLLSAKPRKLVVRVATEHRPLTPAEQSRLLAVLNGLLDNPALYDATAFDGVKLSREAIGDLKRLTAGETLDPAQQRRFHRLLLEGAFPRELGKLYVRGWKPVMFVYGAVGLIVAAIIWIVLRKRPEEHPGCNTAECELIAAGRPAGAPSPHGKAGKIPFRAIVTSRSLWADSLLQIGTNIGWVFLVTWLPRYLLEVHHVPVLERGVMSMVPILVGFAGMLLGGRLTDLLAAKIGLRWGRRAPMVFTRFVAAGAYLLCVGLSQAGEGSRWNSPWMFVAAFSLVALFTDMGSPAAWAFKQDVGGRHVGSILGWGNMWGNLGAACSPSIYNAVLGETPAISDWNTMFLVCMGAFVFAGLAGFAVDATIPVVADEQPSPDR